MTNDGENVPEDLRFAAIMQTKILFDRREELSLSNRSLEGGSIGLLTPLTLPQKRDTASWINMWYIGAGYMIGEIKFNFKELIALDFDLAASVKTIPLIAA